MSPLRGGLVRGAGADLGDDPVPPQGQIGSEDEGGTAALDAVHLTGHGPVLSLNQLTDIPALKQAGVAEVFTPGTPTSAIVDFIKANVKA